MKSCKSSSIAYNVSLFLLCFSCSALATFVLWWTVKSTVHAGSLSSALLYLVCFSTGFFAGFAFSGLLIKEQSLTSGEEIRISNDVQLPARTSKLVSTLPTSPPNFMENDLSSRRIKAAGASNRETFQTETLLSAPERPRSPQ